MFTRSYRYGFQGQERDDEVKGEGNSINYKYRMHDPRIGRFFAVDPLTMDYPELTPYQFSSNSPIYMIEIEGLEGKVYVTVMNHDVTKGKPVIEKLEAYELPGLEFDVNKTVNRDNLFPYYGDVSSYNYARRNSDGSSGFSVDVKPENKPGSGAALTKLLTPPKEVQPVKEEKPFYEKMQDEAWNKGNYGDYLYYYARESDQSWEGVNGARKFADRVGWVGNKLQYIPGLNGPGAVLSGFSDAYHTYLDYDQGDPDWLKNGLIRTGTNATSGIIDNYGIDKAFPGADNWLKSTLKGINNDTFNQISDDAVEKYDTGTGNE